MNINGMIVDVIHLQNEEQLKEFKMVFNVCMYYTISSGDASEAANYLVKMNHNDRFYKSNYGDLEKDERQLYMVFKYLSEWLKDDWCPSSLIFYIFRYKFDKVYVRRVTITATNELEKPSSSVTYSDEIEIPIINVLDNEEERDNDDIIANIYWYIKEEVIPRTNSLF